MARVTETELVPTPDAGTPRTVRTLANASSIITTTTTTTSTTVIRSGWPPVSLLDGRSNVALEQNAPVVLDPGSGAEATVSATVDPAIAVDTRHRTAALTGLGLVAISLSVRALLFRHLDPAAPAPDLPVGGWPIAAALFPHGNVGAAAFVAQAAILAAGLSAARQSRWFTELDAAGRRGALALAVAGGLSLVPVVALVLVIAANVAAVALLVAGAVLVIRALA